MKIFRKLGYLDIFIAFFSLESILSSMQETIQFSDYQLVIVKFISYKINTELYRKRIGLKNVRISHLFPTVY